MWKPTSKSSNLATLLGVRGLNYGLWALSSLLPISVNKILAEYSHVFIPVLPTAIFLLQRLSWRAEKETIWPAKPTILTTWPFTESSLTLHYAPPCLSRGVQDFQKRWTLPVPSVVEWSRVSTQQGSSRPRVPARVACYWRINHNSAKGDRKTEPTKDLTTFRRAYDFCYQAFWGLNETKELNKNDRTEGFKDSMKQAGDGDRNGFYETPVSACFLHHLFSNFLSLYPLFFCFTEYQPRRH